MPARVLVYRLSGPKANQIEEFPAEHLEEVLLGRDPSATIVFDAPDEDVVSRRHAVIRRRHGGDAAYEIADLGSGNGTFVNGLRITSATELQPGDTIELGRGGPRLSFDLEPRPAAAARTRVVQTVGAPATRVVNVDIPPAPAEASVPAVTPIPPPSAAAPTPAVAGEPAKQAVGRETVTRMLSDQRKSTTRLWVYSAAAAVVLLAAVGGVLFWSSKQGETRVAQQIADAQSEADRKLKETVAKLGMTPGEIAGKYTPATVWIDLKWRLYDKKTGKPVFHKTVKGDDGKLYPAFIMVAKDTVVRWLTLDDEDGTNLAIGGGGSGSGFVVSEQGFILTNHHVAANWMMPYGSAQVGIAVIPDPKQKRYVLEKFSPKSFLKTWIPSSGGVLFDGKVPEPIGEDAFEGRNETLDVRFPNSSTILPARLLRAATNADVALIKVDSLQNLAKVELASAGSAVNVGDRLVVLGYPANDNQEVRETLNLEGGRVSTTTQIIPKPTLTEGIVARLTGGIQKGDDGTVTHSGLGETIEMTINASGHGNSGGPVFNSAGKVVGLFTYGLQVGDSGVFNQSGAVPIKYGHQLLQLQ